MTPEIPYFIQIRGCINCDASKILKAKTGKEYGFDHEAMAACVIYGCINHGHSLPKPFIDPEALIKYLKQQTLTEETIKNVRNYCFHVKERFGRFYKSIDTLIEEIDSLQPTNI